MSNPSINNPNNNQQQKSQHCISFEDVLQASNRIKSIVHRTPILISSSINQLCDDRNLFFKVEAMQRTGSFKFRGACNATLNEVECRMRKSDDVKDAKEGEEEAKEECIHIVTHSSGNHAAAVALAAREVSNFLLRHEQDNSNCNKSIKIKSTIVMPRNAPIIKVNGVKGFGGNIIAVDNTNEAREEMADIIVEKENATFIHPSENEFVIAGQGTVCLEMVDQVREVMMSSSEDSSGHAEEFDSRRTELDAVIIPVGGGGLAAGNTISLRGLLGDKVKVGCLKSIIKPDHSHTKVLLIQLNLLSQPSLLFM